MLSIVWTVLKLLILASVLAFSLTVYLSVVVLATSVSLRPDIVLAFICVFTLSFLFFMISLSIEIWQACNPAP